MKVLVAEDDKFLMKLYETRLSEEDYQFITAFDGVDAIEKIKAEKPDLVLLDIMMPRKNGFDVMAEMKQDAELKNIPVIFLSNLGQDSDLKKGLEMGAVDYIVKSNISIEDVLGKIKKHLQRPTTSTGPATSNSAPIGSPTNSTTASATTPANSQSQKSSILCSGCATELAADAHFCPNCGKKIA